MLVGLDTHEQDHELAETAIVVEALPRREEVVYIGAERYRVSDVEWRPHQSRPDPAARLPVLILRPVFTPEADGG
jgi:hypothetical protein